MNIVSLWKMPLCAIVNVQLDHGTILEARYTYVQREHCRHPLYSQGQVMIAIGLVGSHDGQYTTAYIIVHTPWSHSAIYTSNQMFFCFLLFFFFNAIKYLVLPILSAIMFFYFMNHMKSYVARYGRGRGDG